MMDRGLIREAFLATRESSLSIEFTVQGKTRAVVDGYKKYGFHLVGFLKISSRTPAKSPYVSWHQPSGLLFSNAEFAKLNRLTKISSDFPVSWGLSEKLRRLKF